MHSNGPRRPAAEEPAPQDVRPPTLLDGLREGCQIIGRDWRYLYINPAAAAHGRRRPEDLLGRTMMEAYPGIEKAPMFTALRECMEQRRHIRFDNEFTFPDGTRAWFDLRFDPVPQGVFILSLDITVRKLAEDRAERLNAVLRAVHDAAQLIMREKDRHTLILRVCRLLVDSRGYGAAAVVLTDPRQGRVVARATAGLGRHGPDLCRDLQSLPGAALQALRAGEVALQRGGGRSGARDDRLTVLLRQNGSTFGHLAVCVPRGRGGDPDEQQLLHRIADDLSYALQGMELRQERDRSAVQLAETQQQLVQAQKLEAIGRLAGGVAHDYSNLLSAQIGLCELLLDGMDDGDPHTEDVRAIKDCADRAAKLTRQLLAFSRRQARQVVLVDCNLMIKGVSELLRRLVGANVDMNLDLAADLGAVRADPAQVEQVIMNLAVNARDAMPGGGTLTIATANADLDAEQAAAAGLQAGPYVRLTVRDTGIGMDEATRARLFEPFFTTKESGVGTGLGLSTVYGIVQQSGGAVLVDSAPGRGATFDVWLPRIAEQAPPPADRASAPSRGAGETVLVVEDESTLRGIYERVLEDLGYTVHVRPDASGALAAVREEGVEPRVLVTDMNLPGMSGAELSGALRKRLPDLKVLYISGRTRPEAEGASLPRGAAFLQKPFSNAELALQVQRLLGAREGKA